MNTNDTAPMASEVENEALKRARLLGLPILDQLLTGLDPMAALRTLESVIIRQASMPNTHDCWDPLLSQKTSYRSQHDTGLLAFWIDANHSIPTREPEPFRIERFDRGMDFLEKLMRIKPYGENSQRDKALLRLMSYSLELLEFSPRKTFDRWQRFLCLGSFLPEVCSQSVHDRARNMPVETAFWLMDNLCEDYNESSYSDEYENIVHTRLLVARQLSWVIWHRDQPQASDYMRRARLLKGPMTFISLGERMPLVKSEEEFCRIRAADVYVASDDAVGRIVAAAKAFDSIDSECLIDQAKGMCGKWGTYLRYAGMKRDPLTLRITEVAFLVEGRNGHFGRLDIDARILIVQRDLEKAAEHMHALLLKAGVEMSINGPILLRSSATFPCDFGTPDERQNRVDRIVRFEHILE